MDFIYLYSNSQSADFPLGEGCDYCALSHWSVPTEAVGYRHLHFPLPSTAQYHPDQWKQLRIQREPMDSTGATSHVIHISQNILIF